MPKDGKFHLIVRRKQYGNKQGMARMSQEAYTALLEVALKSGLEIKDVLSQMVLWCSQNYAIDYVMDVLISEDTEVEGSEKK